MMTTMMSHKSQEKNKLDSSELVKIELKIESSEQSLAKNDTVTPTHPQDHSSSETKQAQLTGAISDSFKCLFVRCFSVSSLVVCCYVATNFAVRTLIP